MNFEVKDYNKTVIPQNNLSYTDELHYLCINSSDRDPSKSPKVNDYRIYLQDTFKNISSIEIVMASIANKNSVQNYPYLIVKLDGLDHLTFSNNNINNGFALLYLKPTVGTHVYPELGCLQRNVRYFNTPLASLNSLRVSFYTPAGVLFDFGEPDGDITVPFQNSIVFKITTREVDRRQIQQKNVYY